MVKKGSFFARIADRFRSGSGLRVDEGRSAPGAQPARTTVTAVNRVEPRAGSSELAGASPPSASLPSTGMPGDVKSTRRLNEREEAMVAVSGHFQELAALLRGVHNRLDTQLGRIADATGAMHQLPALSQQQLETLHGLAEQLERQNQLGEQIARSVQVLPEMTQKVEQALQRAAQSDERTAATIVEFRATMDRVHASMSRMVGHTEQQAESTRQLAAQREDSLRSLTSGLEAAQKESVRELRETADQGLASLRRSHEDQSTRMQRLVKEHAGWNKALFAVLGVVALGVVALVIVQLTR
jgi:chromosome segregation ATPase